MLEDEVYDEPGIILPSKKIQLPIYKPGINLMQKRLMQEIFMIPKTNWRVVDLEMGQYEHSSFPVCYN